ncbi:MAG: hypothetical protein HY719_06900, partial [Planctomycetes bacterium]|nr:hypothetical protein [Planctomycetota bacterium]
MVKATGRSFLPKCLLAALALVVLIPLADSPLLAGGPPGRVNFQGRLTDASGNPVTAATAITFSLWT